MLLAIIRKAALRGAGILLLFALSYRVLGQMPHAATWVFLSVTVFGLTGYGAWREAQAKKPRLP